MSDRIVNYRPGDILLVKGEVKRVKIASSLALTFEGDERSYHAKGENISPIPITEMILMNGFKLFDSKSPSLLVNIPHNYFWKNIGKTMVAGIAHTEANEWMPFTFMTNKQEQIEYHNCITYKHEFQHWWKDNTKQELKWYNT